MGKLQGLSREEMGEKMREVMKPIQDERNKTLATILKPEQMKRFLAAFRETSGAGG